MPKDWLGAFVAFLIAGIPPLHAAVDTADLTDITVKFVRNMKLIESLTPEPEIRELIKVSYSQADGVAAAYREGNADMVRRKIRQYQEEIKLNPDIDDKHRRDLAELQQELKEKDEEGKFKEATRRYKTSSEELVKNLNLIQTSDERRAQLVRITLQHVRTYQSALALYPN